MKNLFHWIFFVLALTMYSCEVGDDESSTPLVYDICDEGFTFTADEMLNPVTLDLTEIPDAAQQYLASEFPGFSLSSATIFETADSTVYIEITAANNGIWLFDMDGNFICGDDTFANYDDDDDDDDDEYIDPENLPQAILNYIAENYPNATIKEAEFEDGEYEIELDNDVELCFDADGNFIGEDC